MYSAAVNDETLLWKGSPSQWLNFGHFLLALLLTAGVVAGGIYFPPAWGLLVLPVGYAGWSWLRVHMRKFELTSQRLRVYEGVINQNIHEIELYRVKDTVIVRPIWMRMTGLATVSLETSELSLTRFDIPAIRDGVVLREHIRTQVELVRDSKRVREVDFADQNVVPDDVHHG